MELVLLTDYRGALRQRQQEWQSLHVGRLRAVLAERGVHTEEVRFAEVANGRVSLTGRTIHYTSTQDPRYRVYVDDVLQALDRHNRLLPRYDIFRAHENKGVQERLRRELGLGGPSGLYFGSLREVTEAAPDLAFPLVLKANAGFQGRTVQLVKDVDGLVRAVRRLNRPAGLRTYRLKEWVKKTVLRGRYHPEMYTDCIHTGGVVLQEFIPGAEGDWKVLVFGDRLYALRRGVRPGDFRASGSGRFAFDTPPQAVLTFARETARRLDVPVASLDILDVGDRCRLVEFQGLHFGTLTLDASPHVFRREDGGAWRQDPADRDLETEYAHALADFLQRPDETL